MVLLSEYTDEAGGLILDGTFDPDAQATVTDYIDYTEYLPADLIRSLTLIRGLDERYGDAAQDVHDLTKTYGQLPGIAAEERPVPQRVRKEISSQLDRAINARESAYAEACRLYDVVDHHFNRLDIIRQKLDVLPKPASQEASPPAQQGGSKRAAASKKKGAAAAGGGADSAPRTRITLRVDSQDTTAANQKPRSRRSMVSAEHLAGFNPDSPLDSTEQSDVEEPKTQPSSESLPEPEMTPRKKDTQRRSRPSVSGATPSGISTSNALALLRPPPENAQAGSEDMPWLRLTEWEMTKLRKKMKKNAIWQPSEVMIHRELALRGRGWEAYRAAKAQADADRVDFVDCDDIANTYIPGKLMKKTDATRDSLGMTETKLSNRGMKLNEAKKLKRENLAREQAAAAASAAAEEGTTKRSGDNKASTEIQTEKPPTRSSKRKMEGDSPMEIVESRAPLRSSKRNRASNGTSDSPLDANPSLSSTSLNTETPIPADNAEARKPSPAPATTTKAEEARPPANRSHSRGRSISLATNLRRKSATPARKTPGPDGQARRRKRPAPGPVSSGQDGGAAVSYGRRKAKLSSKKRAGTREPEQRDGLRLDEDGVLEQIDSSEPRYCICGDVSFGTMICCENPDVCFPFPSLPFPSLLIILTVNSATRNGSISTALDCLKFPVERPNGSVLTVALDTTKGRMGLLRLDLVGNAHVG